MRREKMKCPYRKIIYHFPEGSTRAARDEEGYAECYGKECPFYDNGYCSRILKKGSAK